MVSSSSSSNYNSTPRSYNSKSHAALTNECATFCTVSVQKYVMTCSLVRSSAIMWNIAFSPLYKFYREF